MIRLEEYNAGIHSVKSRSFAGNDKRMWQKPDSPHPGRIVWNPRFRLERLTGVVVGFYGLMSLILTRGWFRMGHAVLRGGILVVGGGGPMMAVLPVTLHQTTTT